MDEKKIKTQLAKEYPIGTRYTVIRRSMYQTASRGIVCDYKVGYDRKWIDKRIKEIQEQYPKHFIRAERKILGITVLRGKVVEKGKKRQRTGGHGFYGGDGYKEIP